MGGKRRRKENGDIVFGMLLLLFGALILVDNVDILDIGSVLGYWPLILVVVGINKIFISENRKELGGGAWLVFLGLWLFVSIQHIFGFGFLDTWPMLIIAWGVGEIWKALPQRSASAFAKENNNAD